MRRGHLFWGSLLLVLGVLFLLDNLGYLPVGAWALIGPLFLVALGLWVLGGVWYRQRVRGPAEVIVPLEGARRGALRVRHGAGRLAIGAGAIGDTFLSGSGGGLQWRARREGELLEVDLYFGRGEAAFSPWGWGRQGPFDWSLSLNGNVPLTLEVESGADETSLDLRDLQVAELHVQSGASSTRVTLPAVAGHTRACIRVGAAAVDVRVPEGVAASIRVRGALAGISVDAKRFPPLDGDTYRSPDYEMAAHRAEIDIEAGVGAVSVR